MRILLFILPVVIYFLAEQFLGPLYGMVIGIAISLLQWLWDRKQHHNSNIADLLMDVALIALFGLSDIITEHLAPNAGAVVTSATITIMMAISLIPQCDYITATIRRMMPSQTESPYLQKLLKESKIRLTLWAAIATLIFVADFIHPNEWIEKYALITIMMAYFATEFIMARIRKSKYKDTEWVVLTNEQGKVLGGCPRPLVHNGSHWMHAVVHLHVIHDGKLLLQLRPKTKKIQPGKWDTAVGGHISWGEDLKTALQRETFEEIGLENFEARLTKQYVWKCDAENEFVFVFETDSAGPFKTTNQGEVDELRFWSADEIKAALGQGILTGNLEKEITEGLLSKLSK